MLLNMFQEHKSGTKLKDLKLEMCTLNNAYEPLPAIDYIEGEGKPKTQVSD